MAYISREHKFLFLQAPGTGSSTIVHTLTGMGIGEHFPERDIIKNDKIWVRHHHTNFAELKRGGLYDQFDEYFKFVGVRNLFAWHVAQYVRTTTRRAWQVRNKNSRIHKLPPATKKRAIERIERISSMSFEENLKSLYSESNPKNPHEHYHTDADFFVRCENIDEDLRSALRHIGITKDFVLQTRNVTPDKFKTKPYKEYYDSTLIDFVHTANAPFFERFPYYRWENI